MFEAMLTLERPPWVLFVAEDDAAVEVDLANVEDANGFVRRLDGRRMVAPSS